ncbi:Cobalt-zinc-cadmium resistance protein [Fimbriimonas ginsengisoli Gsoil 348]|uniref:Cobalt-zinc-cadmium resistance protein n=2 Tax=Fimbriimonas ginsengisoli TaxID=1005039 RepID=A0A068NPR8_FIMGI|nr:Cobalt-zinc-cadmium resistance protein [Fimbriimonas ginsengisoli Gsoil 348]
MWSFGYNVALTLLKIVAAVMTGSVSLLSESVHSATDVVASGIALVSVRAAAAPPDHDHPYGHGKMESMAGFGESILLLAIVGYIVFEAIQRLVVHHPVQNLGIGLWVMAASAVSSLIIGHYVSKVGQETQSVALRSNGQHLMVDFWTSVGVLSALVLTRLTHLVWIDSAFALALAAWIAFGAWKMLKIAFDELVDKSLPEDELEAVHTILCAEPGVLSYHRLRARHSGSFHFVDVHVVVPNDWSVVQAHSLADRIEKRINEELLPAQTVVHIDPYDPAKAMDGCKDP